VLFLIKHPCNSKLKQSKTKQNKNFISNTTAFEAQFDVLIKTIVIWYHKHTTLGPARHSSLTGCPIERMPSNCNHVQQNMSLVDTQ
jgi:hypothetical protein